jgi:hypothetical protein
MLKEKYSENIKVKSNLNSEEEETIHLDYYFGLDGWPPYEKKQIPIQINYVPDLHEMINCGYSEIKQYNNFHVYLYNNDCIVEIDKQLADNICNYYNNLSSTEQNKYGQFYLLTEEIEPTLQTKISLIMKNVKNTNKILIFSIKNNKIN